MHLQRSFLCKRNLILLVCLFHIVLLRAQSTSDSVLINPMDTTIVASVFAETLVEAPVPNIGVAKFELHFDNDQITIQAKKGHKVTNLPAKFTSTFELKGESRAILFENGTATIPYIATYIG